ncbi:MAG TPA: hypothetical protein VF183_07385 [Acidimicrobiales bacterium]
MTEREFLAEVSSDWVWSDIRPWMTETNACIGIDVYWWHAGVEVRLELGETYACVDLLSVPRGIALEHLWAAYDQSLANYVAPWQFRGFNPRLLKPTGNANTVDRIVSVQLGRLTPGDLHGLQAEINVAVVERVLTDVNTAVRKWADEVRRSASTRAAERLARTVKP